MKIVLDTCIVIDFLQGREPFSEDAFALFRLMAKDTFTGLISAKSVTDIYYLMKHCLHSEVETRKKISQLLEIVTVVDTLSEDVFKALASEGKDYEDAVMMETAYRMKVDGIVTRNRKDDKESWIKVYTAKELRTLLE